MRKIYFEEGCFDAFEGFGKYDANPLANSKKCNNNYN